MKVFELLHIEHPMYVFRKPPLTRLVATRNLPSRAALKKRKDIKCTNLLKNRILQDREDLDPNYIKLLQDFELKSPQKEGICGGIVYCLLKSILDLKREPTEDELCNFVMKFKRRHTGEQCPTSY